MRRSAVVAGAALCLVGAAGVAFHALRGGATRRLEVMTAIRERVDSKQSLQQLPDDCTHWLVSEAGWTFRDLDLVGNLFSVAWSEDDEVRAVEHDLAETDASIRQIKASTYGRDWVRFFEERRALSLRIQAERAKFSDRAARALRDSDPAALLQVARDWDAVAQPLRRERMDLFLRHRGEEGGK